MSGRGQSQAPSPPPATPRVKKPLNAFMLFMKEMRPKVIEEHAVKESATINQLLGRKVSCSGPPPPPSSVLVFVEVLSWFCWLSVFVCASEGRLTLLSASSFRQIIVTSSSCAASPDQNKTKKNNEIVKSSS